eukprot:9831965-Lingulodinium_polyedra.AAC.1
MEQASGAGISSLAATFNLLLDPVALAGMGFAAQLEPQHSRWQAGDPELDYEDGWAQVAARFSMRLVANRARGLLWYLHGYPGHFAKLLGDKSLQGQ